jgi:transcriptional regulator with XRE-family HTH domain
MPEEIDRERSILPAMKKKRHLRDVIKARRGAVGFSQRELARSVGVTASHIAYIESGRRRPSHTLLFQLARSLGVSQQELFAAAYPELKPLMSAAPPAANREDAWRGFIAVAGRYAVTPQEMSVMRQISGSAGFHVRNRICRF